MGYETRPKNTVANCMLPHVSPHLDWTRTPGKITDIIFPKEPSMFDGADDVKIKKVEDGWVYSIRGKVYVATEFETILAKIKSELGKEIHEA